MYVSTIHDIPLDKLWSDGIRLILTDLDNTLVPWNEPELPEDLLQWLTKARERGFFICIVSNNRGPRVQAFAELAGVAFVGAAKKPRPDAFVEAMRRFSMQPEQTIMIGDQLMTDIRGGNRCGVQTILVLPIHPNEWWGTRIVRRAESFVMGMLMRRGWIVRPDRR